MTEVSKFLAVLASMVVLALVVAYCTGAIPEGQDDEEDWD